MKSQNHQETIQNLAKKLREHSLPYKEGAWEQFEAKVQRAKKPMVIWPYFATAAVLLIAFSLFFLPEQKQDLLPVLSRKSTDINRSQALAENVEKLKKMNNSPSVTDENERDYGKNDDKLSDGKEFLAFQSKKGSSILSFEKNDQRQQHVVTIVAVQQPAASVFEVDENTAINKAEASSESTTLALVDNKTTLPTITEKRAPLDALAELLRTDVSEQYVNQNLEKKWTFGVDFSPNVGSNNQVNMGGGFALSYAVSSKVSISSGISYLQVGAERDPFANGGQLESDFPADRVLALAGKEKIKTLNKSNTSLGGLDIPLNVNYQLSKRVHASAGVSVFNVFTERNLNSYHNQEATIVYSGNEFKRPEPVVRSFYSQEVPSEKNYEGNLNGFINFSLGYSIPLSEKVGVSLEPYVKIPMGSVNENQFNLNNGGLRISTRF